MTTSVMNGKPRRQLADQLDRLDQQMARQDAILDALSEGLNGAVADATKEGTRLAVKDAVLEILADPHLRAAVHAATAPPAAARPTLWERLKGLAGRAAAGVKNGLRAAVAVVRAKVRVARDALAAAVVAARLSWPVYRAAVLAAGVGAAALAAAAVLSGRLAGARRAVGAAAGTAAAWVRTRVRRAAGCLQFG